MANNGCRAWCGTTLVASIIIGLFLVLGVYLILRKLNQKSNSKGRMSSMDSAGAEVSESDLYKAIKSGGSTPVVAMIFANGCGHCEAMKPDFKKAAGDLQGKATLVMVEGPKCKKLTEENQIQGFPTMILYKRGKKADMAVGRRSYDDILKFAKQ